MIDSLSARSANQVSVRHHVDIKRDSFLPSHYFSLTCGAATVLKEALPSLHLQYRSFVLYLSDLSLTFLSCLSINGIIRCVLRYEGA